MKTRAHVRWPCFCALIGMAWSGLALAQGAPAAGAGPIVAAPFQSSRAVGDELLDSVRGGFDDGSGLLASFGLDRSVYVNGNLVSSRSVQIPDIAHITAQQAEALAAATRTNVIQIGPGNSVDPAALDAAGATVIQNSLNNQNIQSLTRLDISLSGLGLLQHLDLQGSLQAALSGTTGP